MPNYSVNKIAAFARGVANLFTRNQAVLLAEGYDATEDIASLTTGANALPVTDEDQEHAKSMQTGATAGVNTATHDAYLIASGALTTASGFLGKRGPEADEAKRLRNGVANQSNPAQVAAFITSVIAYLNTHKPALLAKKFDPTAKIAELTPLPESLTADKGDQESKKGVRGDATTAVVGDADELFTSANDKLEAAIGLYDPDSEFVKEARRLRTSLRGRDNGGETPPPPPPAPPNP